MLVLKLMDHGAVEELGRFKNEVELKRYLIDNTENIFDWIQEEDPEKELPNFEEVEVLLEIEHILDEYDFSWWTLVVEEQ